MIALAIICGVAVGVAPFALISDTVDAAIIAGIFSIVNTLLNFRIIRRQREAIDKIETVHSDVQVARKVAEVIPMRKSDLDDVKRRQDDGP